MFIFMTLQEEYESSMDSERPEKARTVVAQYLMIEVNKRILYVPISRTINE